MTTLAPSVPLPPPRPVQPPWYQMMGWEAWVFLTCGTAIAIAEAHGIHANKDPKNRDDFIKRTISEFTWWLGCYHPDTYNASLAKWRRLAVDTVFMWFPGHVQSAGRRY